MTVTQERRSDLLASVAARHDDALATGVAALVEAYYRHVLTEDLVQRQPDDLLGAVLSHRALADGREPGQAVISAFTPTVDAHGWTTGNTVIQLVTDDTPFVVDSITSALDRAGHEIRFLVHPQLPVVRDGDGRLVTVADQPGAVRESWVHVEVTRVADPAALGTIVDQLQRVLADVRAAVADWQPMLDQAAAVAADLTGGDAAENEELRSLLKWMAADNFLFLGYCQYRLTGREDAPELTPVTGTGLGLLRHRTADDRRRLTGSAARKAREPRRLILTKANSRSTVHRSSYLDYVGVKTVDAKGRVTGEHRFLGLFTSRVYSASVTAIPFLASKLARIRELSGFTANSHSAKDVLSVLEAYPRDELIHATPEFLAEVSTSIVASRYHRQTQLFLRRDDYGRFISCLVYLPRDRYNTAVRQRIQQVLLQALDGVSAEHTALVTDSPLAMVHFVVRSAPGTTPPEVEVDELEAWLRSAIRTWETDWRDAMAAEFGEDDAARLIERWAEGFDDAYRATYPPRVAAVDVRHLEELSDSVTASLYQPRGAAAGERRLKLYAGEPIGLTEVMPILLDFGLQVTDERPHLVRAQDRTDRHILDFGVRAAQESYWGQGSPLARATFLEALTAVWQGRAESDRFNQLVGLVGLSWRQVSCLRVVATYLKQTTHYSRRYLQTALTENPAIAALLVELFETRFDPRRYAGQPEQRAARETTLSEQVLQQLTGVPSLDHDRIIRCYLSVVQAAVRTNFYQLGGAADDRPIALKLDPRRIGHLPAPRPAFEVWVYSPGVEGVHLRFGKVARGGLRWSDREEDFRTEVLGLVKAQMVKNAVIVPTGAKGGFYPKRLPDPAIDRPAWLARGAAAYRSFVGALLSITDNLVDGTVVPSADVVRHDEDDTYLVVAADKGTAAFSDLANSVSHDHGFWLDDAFASGGSTGYDHKEMGITARGAWESVKRHFLELGVDVATDQITAVGIGDMSGDVFGNGMLLSHHLKLVAAFDHRHIFLDPDPDPAASFEERRRLFELPASSWADYSPALISAGGGVFPRSAKAIPVSPELRRLLPLGQVRQVTPTELIRAILQAEVDLLWNGGIGTYIKATDEPHAEIGDRANDPIRVNGSQLRCRVVGEGGNLGASQRGRIEAALAGVRINTDAIDNSGGVDSSDHEVNLKILLDHPVRHGELTVVQRNQLLKSMTDEVAAQVLRTNYVQNILLSNARHLGGTMLGSHERLMQSLTEQGLLERQLEALPEADELDERGKAGRGLTSPEFSVLIAYAKLALKDELLRSDLPDDPWFETTLRQYFPSAVRGFDQALAAHPLRREIIANAVANSVVNRGGITFAHRALEEVGSSLPAIAKAFVIAREVFDLAGFVDQVEALDGRLPAAAQSELYLEFRRLLDQSVRVLLGRRPALADVRTELDRYLPAVRELRPSLIEQLRVSGHERFAARRSHFTGLGVPEGLADAAAGLVELVALFGIVDLADRLGEPATAIATAQLRLSSLLGLDTVQRLVAELPHESRWDALARSSLREDLQRIAVNLAAAVLQGSEPAEPIEARVAAWLADRADVVGSIEQAIAALEELAEPNLGPLWLIVRDLQTLSIQSRE
ncbi:MAG: NAD-glutamate dehydrogenase [Propionicimonas sp.]